MSYRELLGLPIRTFWFMSDCIERIQASEDQRSFRVANNAQGGEQVREYIDSLSASVGKVYVIDELYNLQAPRDTEGFEELRAMTG